MPRAAKAPEVKEERAVLLDPAGRGETSDHLDPWVCPDLKDPAGCRFQARLAAPDLRETSETRACLDRKVHEGLQGPPDPSDRLESGALKERTARLDPEAPRGPWDPQDLLETQVQQANQETPEWQVLLATRVPKETRERGVTSLLRT